MPSKDAEHSEDPTTFILLKAKVLARVMKDLVGYPPSATCCCSTPKSQKCSVGANITKLKSRDYSSLIPSPQY